jgi:proteic killer suppression protein
LAARLLCRRYPSQEDSGGFRSPAVQKAANVDDATTDADLRVPSSNHFEKLKGALADWHSIRVNEQWRLVFRHGGRGEASSVYLDNHSYR